jgi:hypothetical protein
LEFSIVKLLTKGVYRDAVLGVKCNLIIDRSFNKKYYLSAALKALQGEANIKIRFFLILEVCNSANPVLLGAHSSKGWIKLNAGE